jgi:hypothetical protein
MPNVRYWHARDVEDVAEKLIADHHTDLRDVPIRYVFRDPATRHRGNLVLGKARKVGGLNAALVGLVGREESELAEFLVVEVAFPEWTALTADQRRALVDHELCHFEVVYPDDEEKERTVRLRGHDVEEFTEIVERHGAWRPAQEALARAAGQVPGQTELDPEAPSD